MHASRFSKPPIVDRGPSLPMISVLRFCGLDRSSIIAGIQNGLETLKTLANAIGVKVERVVVIYRNRQSASVTLEVGLPVTEHLGYRNTGEFRSTRTPGGPNLAAKTTIGPSTLAIEDDLEALAAHHGLHHEEYSWQIFADTGDLAWIDTLTDLNLPVRPASAPARPPFEAIPAKASTVAAP